MDVSPRTYRGRILGSIYPRAAASALFGMAGHNNEMASTYSVHIEEDHKLTRNPPSESVLLSPLDRYIAGSPSCVSCVT